MQQKSYFNNIVSQFNINLLNVLHQTDIKHCNYDYYFVQSFTIPELFTFLHDSHLNIVFIYGKVQYTVSKYKNKKSKLTCYTQLMESWAASIIYIFCHFFFFVIKFYFC